MKEYLNKQLNQITKLISGLKNENVDLDKLAELDRSLDMLSHSIKKTRLGGKENYSELPDPGLKQDAVFYFNLQYRLLRFVGSYTNIFERGTHNQLPDVNKFFTPEGFEQFKEKTKKLLKTGDSQSFNSEIIAKNGLLLPVNILLEKISFGQWAGSLAAGMVFLNQTPSDLEDYREILIENLPGMDVYLFDNWFRYVLAGGQEKHRLGLSNADFTGKTLFEVFDEKTQKRLFPFYRNALDGKESEGEVRIKRHIYFISATPVFGINKKVVGGALISQDVTKEKEIEKKLLKAKRQAEEADKAKSLFLANMSHEIRTPLNAIIGFTALLNKTRLTQKQKKFSQLITQSSEHLLSVVNEILFLFKLGMGKIYIEKVPFNIHELIKSVHEPLLLRSNEKNLKFNYSVDTAVPKLIIGDSFRIKQILMNIAVNAINFTDSGEVSIHVFCDNGNRKKPLLRIEILDTGIGIPKKDLHSIFNEFSQTVATNEKKRKGAGLGLTIVRKLVDLLNGRVHVESTPGKGSKFTVVIPFEKTESDVPEKTEIEFDGSYDLLSGKRILFVDDDEHNILLGELILKDWNVDFELALNGFEALKMLEKKVFDIVLLDIQMPGLSGVDVIEKVKANPSNPNHNTKMLAVTANIIKSDIKKYMGKGFDGYILKPFKEELLYNKVCNLLGMEQNVPGNKSFLLTEKKSIESQDIFDTSNLLQTAGNNIDFYNHMLNTFIAGAKDAFEGIRIGAETGDLKEIGKKAHKAIPSFNYFGLSRLAGSLMQLEDRTLRQNKSGHVEDLAFSVANEIEKIIVIAENSKIPK